VFPVRTSSTLRWRHPRCELRGFDLLFALAPFRLPDAVRWAALGFGVVSQIGFYLVSSRNRGMHAAANGAGRSGSSERLEDSKPCEPPDTC
jgi:hypothetical protein